MSFSNTDTNMTSSSGLTKGMQTFYNTEILRNL